MSASVSPSAKPAREKAGSSARARRGRSAVVFATPVDHTAIYHFLTAVFQGPSRGEFRTSLEDPFYEPHDRLLVKRGMQIVAHVHATHRVMQFGPLSLPVAGLGWLGTLPAFRGRGYGRRLLGAAERHMAQSGALVGLLWTKIPHFFRRTGWALCGRPCHSRAGTRDVLSALSARGLHRRVRRRLNIRPWRRVELGALVRIYNQNLAGRFGPFERTEAYWEWLIRRRAYDQICVALDGPDLLELEEINSPIVGYSVTRGERIVELFSAPGHPTAAFQLLARACGDAVERDHHTVRLHAPPGSKLHKLFRIAGGTREDCELSRGGVFMARLLKPVKVLRRLSGELHRRAEAAGLPRPMELGLLADGKKYRLVLTGHGVRAVTRNIGRDYLRLNVADFTRLVLGHLEWSGALCDGRVEASTALALEAGRVLFPQLPLWRPPLDDLPAES